MFDIVRDQLALLLILFGAFLLIPFAYVLSGKTHTQTHASQQEQRSQSQTLTNLESFHKHYGKFSKSMPRTCTFRSLLLEISPDGQLKACFFGTRSRLRKLANRLATTGMSTVSLQGRSFPNFQKGVSSSVFWGRLPDGTLKAFPSRTMLSSSQAIHLHGAPSIPNHLSKVVVSSPPSTTSS